MWAGRPGLTDITDPVPIVTYPPPSLTRHIALRELERERRSWRIACVSDSLLGLQAAALAGLGIIAHSESVLPQGLQPITDSRLPNLGHLEFVLLHRRSAPSEAEIALHDAIVAGAHRMRH